MQADLEVFGRLFNGASSFSLSVISFRSVTKAKGE